MSRGVPEDLQQFCPNENYPSIWEYTSLRMEIYYKRLLGFPPPWTDDLPLQYHRFTNVYRVTDRVSQYLLTDVLPGTGTRPECIFAHVMVYKLFNMIGTWEQLKLVGGTAVPYKTDVMIRIINDLMAGGCKVFSGAYVMYGGRGEGNTRHGDWLRLINKMIQDGLPQKLKKAARREAFELLRAYPMVGDFLAMQYLTDLGYAGLVGGGEDDFIVAGPGAVDGLVKCFDKVKPGNAAIILKLMKLHQRDELRRLGLPFGPPRKTPLKHMAYGLFGHEMSCMDVQNVMCEVGKWLRWHRPGARSKSRRTRIKQVYDPEAAQPIKAPTLPRWMAPVGEKPIVDWVRRHHYKPPRK